MSVIVCVGCGLPNGFDPKDFTPSQIVCGKCGAAFQGQTVSGVIVRPAVIAAVKPRRTHTRDDVATDQLFK